MARTNVEIDDQLVGRVMDRYRLRTKRAAIDFALRRLDVEPFTREEALAMRGTGWEGDLDRLRDGYLGGDTGPERKPLTRSAQTQEPLPRSAEAQPSGTRREDRSQRPDQHS